MTEQAKDIVITENVNEEIIDYLLLTDRTSYFTIETEFTLNHIERMAGTISDRGRWKWFAETKAEAWGSMDHDEKARKSHIDAAYLFPRVYFLGHNFLSEFLVWCNTREQSIQKVTIPAEFNNVELLKIIIEDSQFSPLFNQEIHND